jgi:hypothetical protein
VKISHFFVAALVVAISSLILAGCSTTGNAIGQSHTDAASGITYNLEFYSFADNIYDQTNHELAGSTDMTTNKFIVPHAGNTFVVVVLNINNPSTSVGS